MLSRSSFARVTSDQHQSGHGSTTGRVRRLAGSLSKCRFGDMRTGALRRRARSWNALPAMPPSSMCTSRAPVASANSVAKSFHACQDVRSASTSTRSFRAGTVVSVRPAGVTASERLGPQQPEVQPLVARPGPRNRCVEAAVEDARDLNVARHDPFVDADIHRRRSGELLGKPADVADAERTCRSRDPALCACGELENLTCVGQQHPSGRRSTRRVDDRARTTACPDSPRAT